MLRWKRKLLHVTNIHQAVITISSCFRLSTYILCVHIVSPHFPRWHTTSIFCSSLQEEKQSRVGSKCGNEQHTLKNVNYQQVTSILLSNARPHMPHSIVSNKTLLSLFGCGLFQLWLHIFLMKYSIHHDGIVRRYLKKQITGKGKKSCVVFLYIRLMTVL